MILFVMYVSSISRDSYCYEEMFSALLIQADVSSTHDMKDRICLDEMGKAHCCQLFYLFSCLVSVPTSNFTRVHWGKMGKFGVKWVG